jgi:hypothetical protein
VSSNSEGLGEALDRARQVKQDHEAELLARANVVGVGVGFRQTGGKPTRQVAIVVMVRDKVPETELRPGEALPREIDGVPVDVQAVGEFGIHA